MGNFLSETIKMFFGTKAEKDAKAVLPKVNEIKAAYQTLSKLSNDELRAKSRALMDKIADAIRADEEQIALKKAELKDPERKIEEKERIAKEVEHLEKEVTEKIAKINEEILPEAFAIVKDTARRFSENETTVVTATDFDRDLAARRDLDFVSIDGDKALYKNTWTAGGSPIKWDMVHYDAQLFGGVVLDSGKIAEMATGEGKTLVSTLPVFLNALCRKGVHVVTVNDYLSRRDSEWMGPIFQFHGLSVDCIDKHQPNSADRVRAYEADVTYGTNNEFGFDYLRDNMANAAEERVQRKKHHFAIVDEVDSVLVDDARTPLIISGPVPKGDIQMFDQYKPSINNVYNLQLKVVTQLLVQAKKLIAEGNTKEGGRLLFLAHKGLPKYSPLVKYESEQGIKTLIFENEKKYLAEMNNKMIADKDNPIMPEINDKLFFVVDEQMHSADFTEKGFEVLSKNFEDPEFFLIPNVGEQIAEIDKNNTTAEEKQEKKDQLYADYSIKSERNQTVSQLLKAYTLFEKDVEYVIIENKVKIVDEQTGRIMEGRRYSDGLHQAIEAKEGVNVEAATQTFATITLQNYFRMYKKLAGMTGTAETEAAEFWNIYKLDVVVIPTNRPVVRHDRHDIIYRTKREKYGAVIAEIEKLVAAGRPVLVGTTSVEVSEFLSRSLTMRKIAHNVLNAKQHQREAQIVQEAGRKGQVTIATNMAGRGTDIKLTDEVKAAGGLAIIGTERHESRRVDRQLRGRAGRQGDPGSSQFFVSFEDDLMRIFGSDKVIKLVDRMGMKEGESLQSSIISSSIEKAQKRVEENNFGIRKRLLEYDDIMNAQRKAIYTRRNNALDGDLLDIDIFNMMSDYAYTFIRQNKESDWETFRLQLAKELSLDFQIDEKTYETIKSDDLAKMISEEIYQTYQRKIESIAKMAYPVIKSMVEQHGDNIETVGIPFTDGQKGFHIRIDAKKAIDTQGHGIYREYAKLMVLFTIDDNWKEHLRNMDDLRQSAQNASYEQKDPLLIYKMESFGLFSTMVENVNKEVISILLKSFIPMREGNPEKVNEQKRPSTDVSKLQTSRREVAAAAGQAEKEKPQPVRVEKKIGRNEPCPCGSGKKYKHCHGMNE